MHFKILGEGRRVLLLCHGFGESDFIWEKVINYFECHCRLIVPTLPGCYPSPLVPGLSIESMANNLHEIVLQQNIRSFYFVGHSMGGYIGLAYAKKYPKYLKGLTLVNSTAITDSPEKKQARLKTNDFIKTNPLEAYFKATIPGLYGTYFQKNHAPQIKRHISKATHTIRKGGLIAQNFAMLYRKDSLAFLKTTLTPIQFIIGQHDAVVPYDVIVKQAYLPKNGYRNVLPHIGHMSLIEAEIAPLIEKFMEMKFN